MCTTSCDFRLETSLTIFITSHAGAVAKNCDEYVCLCVCLSVRQDISGTTRAIFTKFLCMLPMSVARSSSDMFTKGHMANRRDGVFFPTENALSARKGGWQCTALAKYAIYDCVVDTVVISDGAACLPTTAVRDVMGPTLVP